MEYPDYERIILAMSIVSLFPLWASVRLWLESPDGENTTMRILVKSMMMMYGIVIAASVLLRPLFTFITEGKVLP